MRKPQYPADALCRNSPTGVHFHLVDVFAESKEPAVCDICGVLLRISGALWVTDRFLIREQLEPRDLLASSGEKNPKTH